MEEDDCIVLQRLAEKLSKSELPNQLLTNELTPDELCGITSTLNNILVNLFENEKFTSICEMEEAMEAAAKKYNFVFERIVETEKELKAPIFGKKKPRTKAQVEKVDFSCASAAIDKAKAEEISNLLRKSKEAEFLNLQLSKDLASSKEELKVLKDKTNVLDSKLKGALPPHPQTNKPSKLASLSNALVSLTDEKETLLKEQSELANFMDEIEVEIRMKQDELIRMKHSLENEQKLLSATKNNYSELIKAQAMGALSKNALLTPLHGLKISKEGEDLCLKAKICSENKDFPMSSFSMRFSSIAGGNTEGSSIGPCIKRITFSSTAKKEEVRSSCENNNQTSHYILAGLSQDKNVDISEFSEKDEVTSRKKSSAESIPTIKKTDTLIKKEKACLCTIF